MPAIQLDGSLGAASKADDLAANVAAPPAAKVPTNLRRAGTPGRSAAAQSGRHGRSVAGRQVRRAFGSPRFGAVGESVGARNADERAVFRFGAAVEPRC